jgi:2-polyprenyl-6-methoxyphenol hydroxylase-like FAD-dependent oxidoreductase
MSENHVDVLIAGAGPVGLSAAIELGRRGIRCMVVERNERVGLSPRAKTTNVRTREHLRRWGIADALRAASPMGPDYPCTVVFATRMNGPELARFENAVNGSRERNDLYSEEAQWVPQYVLEEVLRQRACSLPGVTVTFNAELTSFRESAQSVVSVIKHLPSGETTQTSSSYVIGADGARSLIRERMGASMVGTQVSFRNYNTIFHAPELATRQRHGKAIMYWMVNEEVPSVLGPLDEKGLWSFTATKLPGNVDPATLDPIDLIRRGTGLRDLKIEVVANFPWVAHQLIADRYQSDRVFLAGDACHLHPPFGGFGMNMGIADAVDLGWKIAATLQGWGGPELLDTYQVERRRVHERTTAESVFNYGAVSNQLVRPGIEEGGAVGEATRNEVGEIIRATKMREFKTLGVVLGYRYESSIIIAEDGEPPVEDAVIYVPSAYPGCLAPHLWLRDGTSLYDHFGEGFTLLVTEGEQSEVAPLVQTANALRLPLHVLSPGDQRLRLRYKARFALIRPDQHVAWRGDMIPADSHALLSRVAGNHSTFSRKYAANNESPPGPCGTAGG